MAKLPKFLAVEPKAYTPAAVSSGQFVNTVRWRYNALGRKESNTRIVRWDDGSMTLLVGTTHYPLNVNTTHGMLFVNHLSANIAQAQTNLVSLAIMPDKGRKMVKERRKSVKTKFIGVLDNPTRMTKELEKLEQEAIGNGSAIGTGSGLDVTIETVAEWAKTLQEKGIMLVPVSTIYRGRAS